MAKIMECIPNISEGRRLDLVEEFADIVRAVPGVTLIDYSSDASHNRSVFTFLGDPDQVVEAAFLFAQHAVEKIDLRVHEGEHPRMGAVDVIPFVPIRDMEMAECVELSKKLGERLSSELDLPVFLYEESASAPHRKNLAAIRKGQFEGMAQKVLEDQWHPDFGGNRIHPSAGVVAVGARQPLIAFNINLDTSDVSIAKKIAKIIREKDGGFRAVKALGVMLEERNIAQVSINMCDYKQTPLYRVLEFVRFEAARYGVHVVGTEIIGLAPMMAFVDAADYYLQIEKFDPFKQVLECHLL
ncbi:MAG: glutamate formimidoyltransferase [Clostridia bacterium]|nr:glutamate formimidoyltransferase [Clostridia bacterium]